jgi:REP element-mobilizing transposase RayT
MLKNLSEKLLHTYRVYPCQEGNIAQRNNLNIKMKNLSEKMNAAIFTHKIQKDKLHLILHLALEISIKIAIQIL